MLRLRKRIPDAVHFLSRFFTLEISVMLLAATTMFYEIAKDKMSLHVTVLLNHNRYI